MTRMHYRTNLSAEYDGKSGYGLYADGMMEIDFSVTSTDTINDMAESLDDMARKSRESNEVAQRSVDIAHKGSQMVQQTMVGMDTILRR